MGENVGKARDWEETCIQSTEMSLQLNNKKTAGQILEQAKEIDIFPNGGINISPKKMYKWTVHA